MKKILILLLIFTLIFSSFTSFAADGDIIHTGLKRVYRVGTSDIANDLMNDVMKNIDNPGFLAQFYREKNIDGVVKYINVIDEENAHLDYLRTLPVGPEGLEEYIVDHAVEVTAELENKTAETAKIFGEIDDSIDGKIEDYIGSSDARRLKNPDNYYTPVIGIGDDTTRIMKLNRPTNIGATKWVYKITDEPIHLRPNEIIDGINYTEKTDIAITAGKYILLSATDKDNKVKAYDNILVTADMIKKPKVIVEPLGTLNINFSKSTVKSGATVVSQLPEGIWKIAVLHSPVDVIYDESIIVGSLPYVVGMEIVLANDIEADNMNSEFVKQIIIYSEDNGYIDKYKIIDVTGNYISGALNAKNLVAKADGVTEYNYSLPVKGIFSGSTTIAELNLPTDASKWAYAFVEDNLVVPKLDRAYTGSVGYEIGQDIPVEEENQYLILLALNNSGKVKAYAIVEILDDMVRDPLAEELKEFTNYSIPEKGSVVGTTGFQFLNYSGETLYYELSETAIKIPEKNSNLPSGSKEITLKDAVKIFEISDPKLRDENGFTRYMMVYAVIGGKVVASTHENFVINSSNVKLPDATLLPESNYKNLDPEDALKPGTISDSTILKKLNKNDIPNAANLKYVYKFVTSKTVPGINEIAKSIKSLEQGKDLSPAKLGEFLLILLVDNSNRIKYYAHIELNVDNTRTSDAKRLVLGLNFSNPEHGTAFGSTRIKALGFDGIEGATQFMIATSSTQFKAVELNSEVGDAVKYATINNLTGVITYYPSAGKTDVEGNILGVDGKNNRYLLLIATDSSGKVKGYINLTLSENSIRGEKATLLTATNFTLGPGTAPGTVRFSKLSPFGLANAGWMYKWSEEDVFTLNPPFTNQVITDGTNIRTKILDQNSFEGIDDIKVGDLNHGHILLLAVNGNKVAGYTVIPVKPSDVQITADVLNLDFSEGSNPDSTLISGADILRAKKYIITTTEMDKPGPKADLPKTGVKDIPNPKEISLKIGEHLRIFDVDSNNKIIGFKDITINSSHIKQGKAKLSILKADGTVDSLEILEGRVKTSAIKISIELTNASWADVINDRLIKDALLDGFKADGKETTEWNKVIQKIKDGRFSISKSGETLTITTTATEDYNISEEQNITLTISPRAIKNAINPIPVIEKIVIKPTIDGNISGSIVNNIRQSQINAGNATIIIDIVDSKWIDTIESSDNKAILLGGFSGGTQWNLLKNKIGMEDIRLVDPQRISITIPANDIVISSPETITLTIPKTLVDEAKLLIIAAPSFTIYPDILPVRVLDTINDVILEAPKFINGLADQDTWIVNLDGTTFKDDFSLTKDLSTSTLPSGLKLEITQKSDKQLSIKLIGKTTKELSNGAINLIIKSTAIKEKNYSDSRTILLPYKQGPKVNLEGVKYRIDINNGIYLVFDSGIDRTMLQYSKNSTNGSNGDWADIPVNDNISETLEPLTIYIREIKQIDNSVLVGKLVKDPAPTGIFIDEYIYDGVELEVRLNEFAGLQYNLGTPNLWLQVPNDKIIPSFLTKDSVLMVRKEPFTGLGQEGRLPSLPTPKLNGLYLGGVKIDVSQSKIIGATKDMKYKLSVNGSWNPIGGNDPVVNFKEGNEVWISDAKDEKNAKKLGEVSQADFGLGEEVKVKTILVNEADLDGIYLHIRDKKMVNNTGIELQYNITKGQVPTGNWINLPLSTTVNNLSFIPGNLFVRKIEDASSLPSNPVKIFEIGESINPPKIEINEDNKTLLYEGLDGSYNMLNDDFEYKINTGEYQNGNLLKTDSKRLGNVTVYVKRKATQNLLESKEVNFKFTENISLANVKVNVADGIIDGTTAKMEYRTDENSPWKPANPTKTIINMFEGMDIWVRESGKPSTEKEILLSLGKMGEPVPTSLEYNIAQKYIKNAFTNILEYRLNDNSWNPINVGQTINIEFVPTRLSIRTKATIDKLPSVIVNVIENIDYPELAPEINSHDGNNIVISINGAPSTDPWGIYEFKLKTDTEWMPGNELKTYDLSGDKIVQIRNKATKDKLSSEIAEIIFTKNIDLTKVTFRDVTPLKLINTEPEMEYQVYLKNKPLPTIWTKATAGTTTLNNSIMNDENLILIVVRDSRTKDGDVTFKGSLADRPVDLSTVKYKIEESGIVLTGISDRIKYKLSGSSAWVDGNNLNVETEIMDIMEIALVDTNYSTNTRTIVVSERAETPVITVGDVKYIEDVKSNITLDGFDKDKMVYSTDNGLNWKNSATNIIEVAKGDKLIVRTKAIVGEGNLGKLPSIPTTQLNGTSLVDIKVDINTPKLINTTEFMEFSLDSTNGKNGSWTKAGNIDTKVALKLGTVIWIREIKNTSNSREIGPIGQEPIPILDRVYYDIFKTKIANFSDQNLEYKVSGGDWKPIVEILGTSKVDLNVEFKAGPLEFRRAAIGFNSASKAVVKAVIKAAGSKPVVVFDDIKDEVITIDNKADWIEYEYKITADNITSKWTPGNLLKDEVLTGNQKLEIRKVAERYDLPSQIREISFTDNEIKRVRLSTNVKPFELNGTTNQMEYSINGATWKLCTEGNTPLKRMDGTDLNDIDIVTKIEVREKNKPTNIVQIYPLIP